MKNIIAVLIIVSLCCLTVGCGDAKRIDGTKYDTYGLFNKDGVRDPGIEYDLIKGNVALGIIFCETIIAPIYFFGFSLYEPSKAKEVK